MGPHLFRMDHLRDLSRILSSCLYVGAFRNAINVGAKDDYFDIQVGQAFVRQWKSLKSGDVVKDSDATYVLTKMIQNIFGFDDLEIHPSADHRASTDGVAHQVW